MEHLHPAEKRRNEAIRRMILNSVCDDYEDTSQINKQLTKDCADFGLSVELEEILQVLRELIAQGWVKAYSLYTTGQPPEEIDGPIDGAYFYITSEGMKRHLEESPNWPFDDRV